jgi:hypothetical protein
MSSSSESVSQVGSVRPAEESKPMQDVNSAQESEVGDAETEALAKEAEEFLNSEEVEEENGDVKDGEEATEIEDGENIKDGEEGEEADEDAAEAEDGEDVEDGEEVEDADEMEDAEEDEAEVEDGEDGEEVEDVDAEEAEDGEEFEDAEEGEDAGEETEEVEDGEEVEGEDGEAVDDADGEEGDIADTWNDPEDLTVDFGACLNSQMALLEDFCGQDLGVCSDECLTGAAQEIQPNLMLCCDELSGVASPEAIAQCRSNVQSANFLTEALECPSTASSSSDPFGSISSMEPMVAVPAFAAVLLAIGAMVRKVMNNKPNVRERQVLG